MLDEEKGKKEGSRRTQVKGMTERERERERETRSDGKRSSAFKKGKRIDERNKKVPVD